MLAATIVLSGRLQVRVEKTGQATTAAKIGEVLNRNEEYRLATEQKAIAIAEKSLLPMLVAGAVALPLAGLSNPHRLASERTCRMKVCFMLEALQFC